MKRVYPTLEERLWSKAIEIPETGCWEWQGCKTKDGYGSIWSGDSKPSLAHRVSYELTFGKISDKKLVCHRCDNPPCINPYHLFLGYDLDNARDKETKGRGNHQKWEKNGRAILTKEQVLEIRKLRDQGYSYKTLVKMFNISMTNIGHIVKLESWKDIEGVD